MNYLFDEGLGVMSGSYLIESGDNHYSVDIKKLEADTQEVIVKHHPTYDLLLTQYQDILNVNLPDRGIARQ